MCAYGWTEGGSWEVTRKRKPENGEGRLVISWLRSSYKTESCAFYIAYYLDDPFVEEKMDSACYSMKILLDGIGEDLEFMGKKLRKKFVHVMSPETEEIRRWYMEEFAILYWMWTFRAGF